MTVYNQAMNAKTNTWNGWSEAWPDWKDAGRHVQTYDDGEVVSGELVIEDFGVSGDGDEYPIWMVECNEVRSSFASCEYWRFLD